MNINRKIETFKAGLLTLFPGIDTTHINYGTSTEGNEDFQMIHFNIPPENKNLIKSPYFYQKKSLVHFSNMSSLISMLQEKSIRLYNLHNLNDPREFTFASKVFNFNESIINDAKDNIFLISFCELGILKDSTPEFNMWRLYSLNGKGLAIIFSILNNPIDWKDFHISKVFYGSNQRNVFVKLLDLIEDLNQTPPIINVDFGKLLTFHKSKLFELEREVRIIYDRRQKRSGIHSRTISYQNQRIFPKIKPDLLKIVDNKDKIQYLKLPLYQDSEQNYDPEIPIIKIEQIIIGYNFIDEVPKLTKSLIELCEEQLGYKPIIKQTRLKNFYWDIKKKK
jgi:hypothetical protein